MPTAIRDEMPQQSSGYPEGTKGEGKRRDSILLWNSLNKHVRENVELRKDIHDHRKLFGRALADPRTERMLKIFKTKHVGPKYILLQDSPFRVNWDIAQFFVLIYVAAVVPLRIGFSLDPTGSWYILELIIVLPVDLAFRIADESFICSLQEEGCDEDNTNPSTVLPKLMKLFRLVRLVKLLRLMRLGRLLDRYQDELFNILRVVACVKLIVFLLYLGHIFGCMMYFFSSGNDWLTPYERQEKAAGRSSAWLYSEFGDDPESVALIHRYVAAAYWAFTTMTTVGYGDIQATTVAERVFSIIGMIAGGFMLSGIIGNLFTIMEQTDLTNKAFNEKMLGVETWVKDLKMEKVDRIKILHWFRKQKIKPYNDRALLGELPLRLRHMIVHHLYHELINLVPFFSGQDMVFKSEFCVCLSPLHVFKDMYVYEEGEASIDMFILAAGEVEIVQTGGKHVAGVLKRGTYIGEGCIFDEIRRKESCRSRDAVDLFSIKAEDIKALLKNYPDVKKRIHAVHKKRRTFFTPSTYRQEDERRKRKEKGPVSTYRSFLDPATLVDVEMDIMEDDGDAHDQTEKE
eukprot:gene3797-4751_t